MSYNTTFFELALELKNSGMYFYEITFFFEGDFTVAVIEYPNITEDFNEFSMEIKTQSV